MSLNIYSISLMCCGILLKELLPELTLGDLVDRVKEWLHSSTKPKETPPEPTFAQILKDSFPDISSDTVLTIVSIAFSLLFVPILYSMYDDFSQDSIEEVVSSSLTKMPKCLNDSNISKGIYDRMSTNEKSFVDCLIPAHQITSVKIGGLHEEIRMIKRSLLPIIKSDIANRFKSSLMEAPSGILLHGPPGCGKTLMAKALAKESGLNFVNVKSSDIKCCYYGKTEAKITALFSFAAKVQPVILFIDEIDSLLRSRGSESSNELSVTRGVKNLFMQHMDGILNNGKRKIVIIGATNRKEDIDPAILRRMQPQIFIGWPDLEQRKEIFENILKNEPITQEMDFLKLANETPEFSGSEIRDICKMAALNILEEIVNDFDVPKKVTKPLQDIDPLVPKTFDLFESLKYLDLEMGSSRGIQNKVSVRESQSSKALVSREMSTDDILKVIAEWKKKKMSNDHQSGMYT